MICNAAWFYCSLIMLSPLCVCRRWSWSRSEGGARRGDGACRRGPCSRVLHGGWTRPGDSRRHHSHHRGEGAYCVYLQNCPHQFASEANVTRIRAICILCLGHTSLRLSLQHVCITNLLRLTRCSCSHRPSLLQTALLSFYIKFFLWKFSLTWKCFTLL